jgi:type II secretory pathway pseudopilin PulG
MRRRNLGFSILELLIALAIVMLVLAAATTFFISTVRQYKIQTKIVETNVEGVLGLELLRQDLESLGFGLPWDNIASYSEASPARLNDSPNPPKAVVSLDNAFLPIGLTVNESDYLVIKSTRVGMGGAAGKWTTLRRDAGGVAVTRPWGSAEEDLAQTDRIIVLSPTLNRRTLVTPVAGTPFSAVANFAPADNQAVANVVYGVDNTAAGLRFPFNRADYYITAASPTVVPRRCAPNTGVLVKRVVSQVDGTLSPALPLLDCAADMQVVYGLDTNGDKSVEDWENDISMLSADTIRTQLAEVRVHILAQEGQIDDSYRTPTDNITIGSQGKGRSFDVSGRRNYRWKVYTIVVKPRSLAN